MLCCATWCVVVVFSTLLAARMVMISYVRSYTHLVMGRPHTCALLSRDYGDADGDGDGPFFYDAKSITS